MTTNAFVGRAILYRGDGGSPEAFSSLCQVFSISGIGQANEQIDATTFCSGGIKEYIPGLADGQEVTFELNLETVEPSRAQIIAMINDVKNKATRSFELRYDADNNGTNELVFAFQGACLAWVLNPSPTDKNTISFTVKITGDIVIFAP